MDQLICASLSHTHYWYEVGMLKVPAGRFFDYVSIIACFFMLVALCVWSCVFLEKCSCVCCVCVFVCVCFQAYGGVLLL